MGLTRPSTDGYTRPEGPATAADPLAWRVVTNTDVSVVTPPLHIGSIGAFLDGLTYDTGTQRWTATWKATHPGNADAMRECERHFALLSTITPDFVADGNHGVTIRCTIHSMSNTGTRLAFIGGIGVQVLNNTTARGLSWHIDDLSGTQTVLTGADAVIKEGGSTNYVGTPTEILIRWTPCGDPTTGSGGSATVDYADGSTHILRATPGDTSTAWTGALVMYIGFGGQGVGSGGSVVYTLEVLSTEFRLDSP